MRPEDPTGDYVISLEGQSDVFTTRNAPVKGKPASLTNVSSLQARVDDRNSCHRAGLVNCNRDNGAKNP